MAFEIHKNQVKSSVFYFKQTNTQWWASNVLLKSSGVTLLPVPVKETSYF
jgi:hypothetical protein